MDLNSNTLDLLAKRLNLTTKNRDSQCKSKSNFPGTSGDDPPRTSGDDPPRTSSDDPPRTSSDDPPRTSGGDFLGTSSDFPGTSALLTASASRFFVVNNALKKVFHAFVDNGNCKFVDEFDLEFLSRHEDREIKFLSANSVGNLLALASRTEIFVLIVLRKLSKFQIACEKRYKAPPNTKIVGLSWYLGTNLLVLTSNGMLMLHALTSSSNFPEESFALSSSLSEEFVSLYVHNAKGWNAFTAYAATKQGDIKRLCPILPKKFTMSSEDLDLLKKETVSVELPEYAKNTHAYAQSYWQMRFTETLVETRAPNTDEIHTTPFAHPPKAVTLGRAPKQGAEVSCISIVSLEALGLVILLKGEFVHIGLEAERCAPHFRLPGKPSALNEIVWIQSVDFEARISMQCAGNSVYVSSENAVFEVSLAPIARFVDASYEKFLKNKQLLGDSKEFPGDSKEFPGDSKEPPADSKQFLANTNLPEVLVQQILSGNKIIALDILKTALGTHCLALTSEMKILSRLLPNFAQVSQNEFLAAREFKKYVAPDLSGLVFKPNAVLPNVPYPNFCSLSSLFCITKFAARTRENFSILVKELGSLHEKILSQKSELCAQDEIWKTLREYNSNLLYELISKTQTRINNVSSRQLKLCGKAHALLQLSCTLNKVSEKERAWIKEIVLADKLCETTLRNKLAKIRAKSVKLKPCLELISKKSTELGSIPRKNAIELKEPLLKHFALLSDARDRIEAIADKLAAGSVD